MYHIQALAMTIITNTTGLAGKEQAFGRRNGTIVEWNCPLGRLRINSEFSVEMVLG
jgi:hypothetical protein